MSAAARYSGTLACGTSPGSTTPSPSWSTRWRSGPSPSSRKRTCGRAATTNGTVAASTEMPCHTPKVPEKHTTTAPSSPNRQRTRDDHDQVGGAQIDLLDQTGNLDQVQTAPVATLPHLRAIELEHKRCFL